MDDEYESPDFDTIRIKQFIEEQTNVNIILYFITIVLYVISFTYLFRKDSTEYMIWILLFILNFVTPLIWGTDMFKLISVIDSKMPAFDKNIFTYGLFCLIASFLLTFVGLLMVLLKNEDIRKIKKHQGHYKNNTEMPDLKVNIKEVEKKDRKISIMYTTIVSMMWGMIAFNFGEYLTNDPLTKKNFSFGSRIKALIDIVPSILSWLDSTILYYSRQLGISTVIKALFVYVIVFIAVFFGIFARIRYSSDPSTIGLKEQIEIVNMTPMFPRRFDKEFTQIRHFIMILCGTLLSLMFGGFLYFLPKISAGSIPRISNTLISIVMLLVGLLFIPYFFINQNSLFDKDTVKDISFFFVCVIFGLVGAAPITAIVQLILSLFRTIPYFDVSSYLFGVHNAIIVYGICAIILAAITFIMGSTNDWIRSDGKNMKEFLVLLVTMTVSLFVALSTKYPVFKTLYDTIGFFLGFAMKFIAPIIMLILSILVVYYSGVNYRIIKKRANDTIVEEKKATETPDKTRDPIKEQREIRNMLKNSYRDFTNYFDVNTKMKTMKNIFGF